MKKAITLISVLLLSACVYYNTLYNANKLFEEAQKAPLTKGRATGAARQKYSKAMKKCGYILTEHKNSQYADDALYLLARCLFYQNNYVQAKEKFVDLQNFYPNFEEVKEANLYIAKCNYKLNQKSEAYTKAQQYIAEIKDENKKAKALKLVSEWYTKDEKHIMAETYLKQIIEKYKDSEEYTDAFFSLGKVAYDEKNYVKSDSIFVHLLDSSVERAVKLDARLYRIKNQLMLENFDFALSESERLIEDEYRTDYVSAAKLVLARALVGQKKYTEAEKEFNAILEGEGRTEVAAETSYYLGEMYFLGTHNYEEAIKAYNDVRKKSRTSEFSVDAMSKSSVATQIVQFKNTSKKINAKDLVDNSFKLAEYYIDVLNMPDSAFVVYKSLEGQKQKLSLKLDTLTIKLSELKAKIKKDSLAMASDSTKIYAKTKDAATKTSLTNTINQLKTAIDSYSNEYIPFSKFVMAWFNKEKLGKPDSALALKADLEKNYPGNIWTLAINDYYQGKPVVMHTPRYLKIEKQLDNAQKQLSAQAKIDSLLAIENIELEPELEIKKDFTVGLIYLQELQDTLNAKVYLKKVQENAPESEYSSFIKSKKIFENGKDKIVMLDRLPYLVRLEEEKHKADSLKALADSTKTDSSKIIKTKSGKIPEKN